MIVLKWIAVLLALLAITYVLLTVYGRHAWSTATRARLAQVDANRALPAVTIYQRDEIASAPAPVRRYLAAVLREAQPIVASARLGHHGTFNLSAAGEQWKPFTSSETIVTSRPAFLWDGRVAVLPGAPALVHDAYVAGRGTMHAALFGLFALATAEDARELAQGELMRFLAEGAWYPTALLPSQGVRWQAIDDHAARATLTDGTLSVTLTFHFNDGDLVDTVRAEARGRITDGKVEMLPWEGRFWNYAQRDGMRVPLEGEVAWITPAGRKPYWRGTLDSTRYEFAH